MRSRVLALFVVAGAASLHVGGCNGDEFEGQASNATGGSGGLTDGGGKDVFTGDQGWVYEASNADTGTGGEPAEAEPDVAPPPVCQGTGFFLTPAAPNTASFDVVYSNPDGLVCIGFRLQCNNADVAFSDLPTPSPCPGEKYCWAIHVSNCIGDVKLEFVEHKGVGNPGDYCYDTYPGSAGDVVSSCQFTVVP